MVLRELFVKLGLDLDTQSFVKGALEIKSVKDAASKLIGVMMAGAAALIEAGHAAIEYTAYLDDTSKQIGLTTDALQELEHAAALSGVSQDELRGGLMKLTANMRAAKEGGEAQAEAFQKLGVKVTDTNGELRSSDDVLQALAEKFAGMEDGSKKTATAMEVFGRSGAKLIPLLNEGSEGIEKLRNEAHDLGLVFDDVAVGAGAELDDNLDRLKRSTLGLWRTAIAPLLPVVNNIVKRFLAWRLENAAMIRQQIQRYIGLVINAVKGLVGMVQALYRIVVPVAKAMVEGLQNIVSWVWELAHAIGEAKWIVLAAVAAFTIWLSPLLAIAAVIGGLLLLVEDFQVYQRGGKSLFGIWKKTLDEWMKPNKDDPWWLAAIKAFVRTIKEALQLIDELTGMKDLKDVESMANKGASKKEMQERIDKGTLETAKKRAALGLPLTDKAKEALGRANIPVQAFMDKYGPAAQGPIASYGPSVPELPASSSGGAASVVMTAPTQIGPIYQQPGQSSEDLAMQIKKHVGEEYESRMEQADAAMSRP